MNNLSRFIISRYNNLIFDLDNTLFDESIYLNAVFDEIGIRAAQINGKNNEIVKNFLVTEFSTTGREKLLDKLIAEFELDRDFLTEALSIYRTVKLHGKIPLFSVMKNLLINAEDQQLFILTNGNTAQQLNKITQIKWPFQVDRLNIIYANNFEPKPSPKSLRHLIDKFSLKTSDTAMIGDSVTDEICAKSLSINFYYVKDLLKG